MTPTAPDFPITPEVISQRDPAWSWEDLALFIGSAFPALLAGTAALSAWKWLTPKAVANQTTAALVFQVFAYAVLCAGLYGIVKIRYGQDFWAGLGWCWPRRAWQMVALGPVLAIALASLGVAMGVPSQPSKIEELISTRSAFTAIAIFGILFGPAFEELVFRGFIFPLVARTTGPWLGVVITAIPFGALHGVQNNWAWQPVLLITVAGVVFGIVRHRTGSTTAAFLLHASYNATQFGLYALTRFVDIPQMPST